MTRNALCLSLAIIAVCGCAPVAFSPAPARPAAWAGGSRVVVRLAPPDRRLAEVVPTYTLADVDKIYLYLYDTAAGPTPCKSPCRGDQVLSYALQGEIEMAEPLLTFGPIAPGDITAPVVFGDLVPRSTYRVEARAFKTEDGDILISDDSASRVTFTVDGDGEASVRVPIRLQDTYFSATTTASPMPSFIPGTTVVDPTGNATIEVLP